MQHSMEGSRRSGNRVEALREPEIAPARITNEQLQLSGCRHIAFSHCLDRQPKFVSQASSARRSDRRGAFPRTLLSRRQAVCALSDPRKV